MARYKFIICTHGDFGKELIKSAEMINGKLEDVESVSLYPGTSPEEYESLLKEKLEGDDDKKNICLVDIFGGTPCMSAVKLSQEFNMEILSGINLAMLLEMYTSRETEDMEVFIDLGLSAVKQSARNVLGFFEENNDG